MPGDPKAARTTLQKTIDSAPDEPTAKQARDMLDLVERRMRAARPYRISVSVAGLYDDNVVIAEIDDTSGTKDGAAEFELSGGYKYKFDDESSVELGYDLFQSVYAESPSFDLQTHTLSLGGLRTLSAFESTASYAFTLANLDNDRLFDSHLFATSLAAFPLSSWYLLASPRVTLKEFDDEDRNALQGSVDVTNFYFFPEQAGRVSLTLGYDHENAKARRFDYNAFRLRVGFHLPLSDWFEFDARYKFRLRDYTGETPSISKQRLDKTHTASATVSRELGQGFEVLLSYEHEQAISNLGTADYVQNHVRLQFRWASH